MTKLLGALILLVCLVAAANAIAGEDENAAWYEMISLNGYVDGRAAYWSLKPETGDSDDETQTSDILVFESALGTHVGLNDYISADAVIYYYEGSNGDNTGRTEDLSMDEYYITATNWGAWAKIGKYYPPIGDFTTYGVGYTRVQDLVWTRLSALGIGYTYAVKGQEDFAGIGVHAFNGDFDQVKEQDGQPEPDDDMIDGFAGNLFVRPLAFMNSGSYALELGGYYLSDTTETLFGLGGNLALQDIANTPNDTSDDTILYQSAVPLYGGYLNGELNFTEMIGIGFAGEYAATGQFDEKEYVDAAGEATSITATHGEIALMIDNKNVQIGGRYGAITGLDWLGTAGFDATWEPTAYNEFGGYIGVDYIKYLHLALQGLAGSDNESNSTTRVEFQAKVAF